ncbi:hypothetical protein [Pseudomonas sp. OTU5201]|uniref:hypothetical protein n=1 Tax=Pseudomonas sp. OTU5201 TaxID=3043850 RepID=UPI00313E2555
MPCSRSVESGNSLLPAVMQLSMSPGVAVTAAILPQLSPDSGRAVRQVHRELDE